MAFANRWIFQARTPNIEHMVQSKDVKGLIKALRHPNYDVQWQAASALGRMGDDVFDHLLAGLSTKHRDVKLGIIDALGEIKNPRAVPSLTALLSDESSEVRWAAAIALGELQDASVIPALHKTLHDTDKYVRYGAALALEKLGYQPADEHEQAWLLLGKQDWDALVALGPPALGPLVRALKDKHPDVRSRVVESLGKLGDPKAIPPLMRALGDENPGVRWKAVLASPKCGASFCHLPRWLAKRPRVRKNSKIAFLLNFILPGQGYNYLGFWWGTLVFQTDITLTLWLLTYTGESLTYGTLFPIYLLMAIHGWWIAKNMPDL